jgi:hypothetical protein
MDCSVSFEILTDYAEGRAGEAEAAEVRAHLDAGCGSCRERLDWLNATLPRLAEAFRAPAPEPVSAGALARAGRLNRLLPGGGRPDARHVFAEALPAPKVSAPIRGATAVAGQAPIHRVYETPAGHRVLVWDEPDEGANRYLIGQVYARNGEAVEPDAVRLLDGGGEIRVAEREGSEFHLPAVPPGACALACEFGADCIVLPHVEVGRA